MAVSRETLELTAGEWTLIEVDPDTDGYVRFLVDKIDNDKDETIFWSPLNTTDLPTSELLDDTAIFDYDIYIKSVNATVSNPIVLSITRYSKYNIVDVTNPYLNMYHFDGFGNPIGSFKGAINTHDAHVHRIIINELFKQLSPTVSTTFTVAPAKQDRIVTVDNVTGFTVGNYVYIEDTHYETNLPFIIAISGNDITLNRPLDYAYSVGDAFIQAETNMAVDGSVTPQSFRVYPRVSAVWHLERILIEMTHDSAGDNGLFGNLSELPLGVLLRRYDGATDTYNTFTTWRNNGNMVTDMYDVIYPTRSGGGGSYGTNGRGTFEKAGAIVFLDASQGDFLEILIQDDLTGLTNFEIKAQGHIEGV